jgi:hypothetical protein
MFFIHTFTGMLYFAGKGDRSIQFVEVTEREPWFVEGLRYTGEQIKGSCLVPKRAMDVMQCEVGIDLSLDPTFYVDANPEPDTTISHKFIVNFSQQCRFKFFSFLDSVIICTKYWYFLGKNGYISGSGPGRQTLDSDADPDLAK